MTEFPLKGNFRFFTAKFDHSPAVGCPITLFFFSSQFIDKRGSYLIP